jgi:carbon starvation protein CstA
VGAGGQGPGEREQAISLLIVGLVLAFATPFLLPAGLIAIVVAMMLVRRGHNRYALVVLLPAVFALVFVGLTLLD